VKRTADRGAPAYPSPKGYGIRRFDSVVGVD
jgi:hypothetical protein